MQTKTEQTYNNGSETVKKSIITTIAEKRLSQITIAFRKEAIAKGWDYDTMMDNLDDVIEGIYEKIPEIVKEKTIFDTYNILDGKNFQRKTVTDKEFEAIEERLAKLENDEDDEDEGEA